MRLPGIGHMISTTNAFVKRYLDHLQSSYIASSTISNRKDILVPFFRAVDKEPEQVTLDDIDKYLFERSLECKQSSIQMEKQALRGFFKYCYEYCEMNLQFRWEIIQRRKVKPPKIETFTADDVAKVVSKCTQIQDKLMISLMFETGMRIGEVLNLRAEDLELAGIHVRGKGENDRIVYMTYDLAKELRDYVVNRGYYGGHVFRPLQKHKNHPNDRYVSAYGLRDRIQAAFKRCGYKMHPHQLRHSFAKNWLIQGGDLRTLQILLGHADLTTTQRYLGLTDKETENIYHKVQVKSILAYA